MAYRLLEEFRGNFAGKVYRHRDSSQGDRVASFLFEDLYSLGRSPKYVAAVKAQTHVANRANRTVGRAARRGDGTFGERAPDVIPVQPPGLEVAVGEVATMELGAEVKVMLKAMIKQLDRVGTDLKNQVEEFRRHGDNPICVGIVGINRAPHCTSYEGSREYPTDGRGNAHPAQEADEAERRLVARVKPLFDELLVLRFIATNTAPYDFQWVDVADTEMHYGSSLIRVSREYERRF